jgi:hypothetical protein
LPGQAGARGQVATIRVAPEDPRHEVEARRRTTPFASATGPVTMEPTEPTHDRDDRPWRPAASGPSFVYVLPCLGEDLLKLGMSRDPLDRLQSLHPRWFDFFDLDAARLVETDSVREARAIETRLRRALRAHNAPAPLLVAAGAGGGTEWFRGAQDFLAGETDALHAQGMRLHAPARPWLHDALARRGGLLFHWSARMLEAIDPDFASPLSSRPPTTLERTLRDALDAHDALGIDPEPLVPASVLRWWREARRWR